MATVLFTWNPRRTPWPDLRDSIEEIEQNGGMDSSWSCGNTRRIHPGDRLFLLRQGSDAPGLVGSAWAASEPYEDRHWQRGQEGAPSTAWYVALTWDFLSETPIIPRRRLIRGEFRRVNWNSQVSGIFIPDPIAERLEAVWQRATGTSFQPLPEETDTKALPEGGRRTITVNRFERDGRLRRACIEYHGPECAACGRSLGELYGSIAEGYVHVHHLRPLADIGRRHGVDPTTDLVPVCPNCHAVMHLATPPLTPEAVGALINAQTSEVAKGRKRSPRPRR